MEVDVYLKRTRTSKSLNGKIEKKKLQAKRKKTPFPKNIHANIIVSPLRHLSNTDSEEPGVVEPSPVAVAVAVVVVASLLGTLIQKGFAPPGTEEVVAELAVVGDDDIVLVVLEVELDPAVVPEAAEVAEYIPS
jgi:hypothetical protein